MRQACVTIGPEGWREVEAVENFANRRVVDETVAV